MSSKHLLATLVLLVVLSLAALTILLRATPAEQSIVGVQHAEPPAKAEPKPTPYEFPGGGRELLPGRQLIALYGTPGSNAMGLLGQQGIPESISRIQGLASEYRTSGAVNVYPTFEIIVTIASSSATSDGDYSREVPHTTIKPWIDAAREAGVYVILDLQPGRNDFLSQAKRYESLLLEPHVGLALDPEWRLKPDQVHLKQIGRVSVDEVNAVGTWLADLTKQHDLPQKAYVLHQFRSNMIEGRERLDTTRHELAYIIHADGQGAQPAKRDTWRILQQNAPNNIYWGWKNFTVKDLPMLTPQETLQVQPHPALITYQ